MYPWSCIHTQLSAPQALSGFVGLVEFEGEEYMTEATAFYSLAATGTVRVGRLCKAPQLLACWALELLEEQACHVSQAVLACAVPCWSEDLSLSATQMCTAVSVWQQ